MRARLYARTPGGCATRLPAYLNRQAIHTPPAQGVGIAVVNG